MDLPEIKIIVDDIVDCNDFDDENFMYRYN